MWLILIIALQVVPTTLDGLPLPPAKNPLKSATDCLRVATPDATGGFCEWYGYATRAQADAFERSRGFVRVVHEDRSGDTWRAVTPPAKRIVACREKAMRNLKLDINEMRKCG